MNDASTPGARRSTLKALVIAAIVAIVVLFTIVLPAERGYDPTGIGSLLGLTAMNAPPEAQGAPPAIEDVTGGNENLVATEGGGFSEPLPLPNPSIHQREQGPPRVDTFEVKLGFDEKTEIKAILRKSKVILYEWSVEGGQVYVDFHGHDPSKGDAYWVRYEEGDGVTGGKGSLVAPFDGEHGWYWLNVSDGPVTIRLKVTGYQDRMMDYGLLR